MRTIRSGAMIAGPALACVLLLIVVAPARVGEPSSGAQRDDEDGDGYTTDDGDCDDTDPTVHPGAEDVCGDDVDGDCDGVADFRCRCHVPEGEFLMGAPDEIGYEWLHPQHAVWLDECWIDKYEVTNLQFAECLAADACTELETTSSFTREDYYGDPEYDLYPVVGATRTQARRYCEWAGGRLTTEAQWEKAARGMDDARLFPWGDYYNCTMGNFNWCHGDTVQVGSYPHALSPFGVADTSGNVWEFIDDWYSPAYYEESPYENPVGPDDTGEITMRGGAFTWYAEPSVSVRHPAIGYNSHLFNIGFRCSYVEAG